MKKYTILGAGLAGQSTSYHIGHEKCNVFEKNGYVGGHIYSEKVNGFCLVSSDSDFTRLATRLREAGMKVFGIGEKKTPQPFIVACDRFIYIEILKNLADENESETTKDKQPKAKNIDKVTPRVIRLISSTVSDLADDDGWAFLGDVGNLLQKKQPNFDSRNYGFIKLTPLIKSTDRFDIDMRESPTGRFKLIYIKNKDLNHRGNR